MKILLGSLLVKARLLPHPKKSRILSTFFIRKNVVHHYTLALLKSERKKFCRVSSFRLKD